MGRRVPPPDDGIEFDYTPLRMRRRLLDVSQRDLAEQIGANANAVLGWEKGGHNYGFEQMWRAARILGTPLTDLANAWDKEGRNAKPHRLRR
jgi:transcriptional regulator with XRE-family HTH domain